MSFTHPGLEASTALTSVSEWMMETYRQGYWRQFSRFAGKTTNKIFSPERIDVSGEVFEYKVGLKNLYSARISASPNSSFPRPRTVSAGTLQFRYNETTPSMHDFRDIKGAVSVGVADATKALIQTVNDRPTAIEDLAGELVDQMRGDFEEVIARYHHLPSNAVAAAVDGNLKKGDRENYNDATAWSGAAASARFKIKNGSIAMFQPGTQWIVGTAEVWFEVNDYNVMDNSIRVTVIAESPNSQFNATASTYADASIYPATKAGVAKTTGMYGLQSWFSAPSIGESWIGGKDRTVDSWLLPTKYFATTAATPVALIASHFNDVATRAQFIKDAKYTPVALTNPALADSLARSLSGAVVRFDDTELDKKYEFGTPGLYWFHPTIGSVRIESDPIANPNSVKILMPQDWDLLMYGNKADGGNPYNWLPGGEIGPWRNLPEPDGRPSMFMGAYGYLLGIALACRAPRQQMSIENVTAG